MQLKELELSGFKSFAKKTKLSFTKPITAIVGPNGSGKSNVAEAFRFALGEQSIKSLRGKRGEDLIFSGTHQAPRSNRAGAVITFDNSSKLFDVDFSEVRVERTVYRDGVNEYALNNSKVRLKDIQELLAHANIGQSGHHIISQGEADRVLSAHPRERREMIEEALGLRVFKYKKEESEKKLRKTEENMAHVESLRKEIAPHMRFLAKQVEKIERAKEVRNDLTTHYQEYFQKEEAWLGQEEEKNSRARSAPEKRLADIAKEREALPVSKVSLEPDPQASAKLTEAKQQVEKGQQKEQELLQKIGRIEGALSFMGEEKPIEEVRVPAERFTAFEREVQHAVNEAEHASTFTGLRQALDALTGVLRPFIKEFDRTRSQEDVRKKREDMSRELAELKEVYETSQNATREARAHLSTLQEEARAEERTNEEGARKRLELEAEEARLSAEVRALTERKERIQVEKEEFEREHREAIALVGAEAVKYEPFEGVLEEPRSKQEERKRNIERMKIRVEELGGGGEDVLKEYEEAKERDTFLRKEVEDLGTTKESLIKLIAELEQELTSTFNEGLVAINTAFNEFFTTMFGGGSARLVTVSLAKKEEGEEEEDDDQEEQEMGVDVSISVPGKRVKGLVALSGGERALTSIALIFAMSQVNPPPFLILDETDAALDEANSKRYGDMIESLAKRSQLILITHNRETMSRAGVIYGVTMSGDGISKLLSIQFEEAVQVAK